MRHCISSLLFLVSCAALAQEAPAPHEAFTGKADVRAHHVRLEGSAFPEQQWALIKSMQTTCTEKMNKSVDLPPPGTVLQKVTSDDYYTATHFVEFKKTVSTFINSKCELDTKTSEEIEVKHPFGHCELKPAKKTAIGQCAASYSGTPIPGTAEGGRRSLGINRLGVDRELNCKKFQWEVGRLQATVCIQATGDTWRSMSVHGQDDLSGMLLSNKIQQTSPSLMTSIDVKATKVEKNIQVSQDLLHIAVSQGYKITEIRRR